MEPSYPGDHLQLATVSDRKCHHLLIVCVCVVHRKSIKKLVLKNLNSSQYSSPINKETDDLASPAEYPQNGHRSHSHTLAFVSVRALIDVMHSLITLNHHNYSKCLT